MDPDVQQKLSDLSERSQKERKRYYARRPKQIANLVASVMAKQGYAASKAAGELGTAWKATAESIVGDTAIAGQTCVAGLKRGVLEVTVANHVIMQEINFVRPGLLGAIQEALPNAKIKSLRFKVGRLR